MTSSGHAIQGGQPQLVVDAIRRAVDLVRETNHGTHSG